MSFQTPKRAVAVCLSLLIVLVAAGGCRRSPEAKRDRFLEAGKRLLAKKQYARAVLEFKNAVRATPRDAESYFQLGGAFEANGELQNAVYAYRRAIELNPQHSGAQLKLARMMASTQDPDILKDAETRLSALLQAAPGNPESLYTLALTELKLGKVDVAVEHLQRALAAAPGALNSSILLAQTKIAQKDFQGAEQVLKQACQSAPKSSDALVILGDFYLATNRPAEAEQQFRRAIEFNPTASAALLELGKFQYYLGRRQEAEQTFKRLSALDDEAAKPVYAIFLMQEGRREEAVREFERLAKANPEDRAARTRLVAAYQAANRNEDARRVLDQALKRNSKDLDAMLQRAEFFLAARQYPQAEMDLNRILHLRPTSPEVHYIYAKLHQARGSALLYRQELSEALRLDPHLLQVRVELAQLLLATNAGSTALQVLNEAPPSQRRLLPVLVARNWALWATGDMAELRKGIDAGLAQQRLPDLLIQDGLWKLRRNDVAGARAALEEALKLNPEDLRALEALRRSYVAQKQAPIAIRKVKEYAARMPNSAPVQQFLGSMLAAQGDQAGARQAFTAATAADPKFGAAQMSLAQLDAADGNWESAKQRLKAALATDAQNVRARYWLGNVEATQRNYDEAIRLYRQVIEASPNHSLALNNLAYFLAEYAKRPDEALKYAEQANQLTPERPEVADTLGWILYQKGLYTNALKYLEHAASQETDIAVKYHLAMAYAKSGDIKRGRAVFEAALKRNPNTQEAVMARELLGAAR